MHGDGDGKPEIVQAHCNRCSGSRRSFVRAEYGRRQCDDGDAVFWWDTYRVLECCGCGDLIVQHEHWFSENGSDEVDPVTGEHRWVPDARTVYFPPARVRRLPDWFDRLETADEVLAAVLLEVYAALEAGSLVLATAGARILLDRAMVLLLGEDAGGFAQKLAALTDKGVLGAEDSGLLGVMTDAGNAASHRGHRPSREHLETILDTIENLLHRKFVLKPAAEGVKAATPPRRGRP